MVNTREELRALKLLRNNELTRDMETKQLRMLATIAREVEFEVDEVIYRQGDRGRGLYLIISGEVVIETKTPEHGYVILNRLEPGQFFGWSSLFPYEYKMAWTRASKPTRAFAFDAARIKEAEQSDQVLAYALARCAGKAMIERIKWTRKQLADQLAAA